MPSQCGRELVGSRFHLASSRRADAVHDLAAAYNTDDSLCNVEVLIENEGDAGARQRLRQPLVPAPRTTHFKPAAERA